MKIAIIGCGKMGLIYARSFIVYNLTQPDDLILVEKDPARQAELAKTCLGRVTTLTPEALSEAEVVILAVKPQNFGEMLDILPPCLKPEQLVISIMAGITIPFIQTALNHKLVVRAMPNTPASVGEGMTGVLFSQEVPIKWITTVLNFFGASGKTVIFENESDLDAVTALSGSGPAYFFYVLKAFVEAGVKMGLPADKAHQLAKQTMLGAALLADQHKSSFDELIQTVASKGGTTEAALKFFNENQLDELLINGALAAEKRAKELSVLIEKSIK